MDLVDLRVHYMHSRDILVLTCFILLMFYNSKKLRAIISIFISIFSLRAVRRRNLSLRVI